MKVNDGGDDEDPRGLKNNREYSQCVCRVELCVSVVDLHCVVKNNCHRFSKCLNV